MTPAEIRRAVAHHLRAALSSEWSEAPVPYDLVLLATPRTLAHPCWSVGLGATTPSPHRQRAGAVCQTDVMVRYLARLRADGTLPDAVGLTDYDEALDREAELLVALLSARETNAGPRGVVLSWQGVDPREAVGEGTYLTGVVRCTALHTYSGPVLGPSGG